VKLASEIKKYLTRLGGRWNISLFHYCNHVEVFCNVLMGLQMAQEEQQATQHCHQLVEGKRY
jgi:hypothetical protein